MLTLQITFHPRNYYALPFINFIEKLEVITGVRRIERPHPLRLTVYYRSKRTLKRMLKATGRENAVLQMHFHPPTKVKRQQFRARA